MQHRHQQSSLGEQGVYFLKVRPFVWRNFLPDEIGSKLQIYHSLPPSFSPSSSLYSLPSTQFLILGILFSFCFIMCSLCFSSYFHLHPWPSITKDYLESPSPYSLYLILLLSLPLTHSVSASVKSVEEPLARSVIYSSLWAHPYQVQARLAVLLPASEWQQRTSRIMLCSLASCILDTADYI